MAKLSEFASRQIDQFQYALFTAPIDPKVPLRTLIRDVFDPTKSESTIYRAMVHIATKSWGRHGDTLKRRLSDRYYDTSNTPLRGITENPPELIGYGGENLVFLHHPSDAAPFVLKIDKRSLGLSLDDVNIRSRFIKLQHEKIRDWYQGIPDFVVPTDFFVARLPFKNKIGIGSIQEYFPEAKDLFTDFADTELLEILTQDRKLRANFCMFVDRFFSIFSETGQCIDLVGYQNVCLVKGKQGNYELRLLDTADIKSRDEEREAFRIAIRETRRNKLRRIAAQIATIPDSS